MSALFVVAVVAAVGYLLAAWNVRTSRRLASGDATELDPANATYREVIERTVKVPIGVVLLAGAFVLVGFDPGILLFQRPGEPVATVAEGVALGFALYALAIVVGVAGEVAGLPTDRSALATMRPDRAAQWPVHLVAVLPLLALYEELLYRGLVVGATFTALYPLVGPTRSLLIVVSAAVFGATHLHMGRGGALQATAIGLGLVVAALARDSLVVAVVGHYVLNVLAQGTHALQGRFGESGDPLPAD